MKLIYKDFWLEKITFIINPVSGRSPTQQLPEKILENLDTQKFEPEILVSSKPGEATEIAAQKSALGHRIIAAVGGDGTVNEVAKSLINSDTLLAIIPFGSGNGLARHLKIPISTDKAIRLINKMNWTCMDYATINGIPYFCTSGVGFDAMVGNLFARSVKRGFLAYFKIVLTEFFRYRPQTYSVKLNGKQFERDAFLITVANASQYGNNAFIAPDADVKDGLLNLCIVSRFPGYKVWELGIRMVTKKLPASKYYEVFQVKEAEVSSVNRSFMHYDGEAGGTGNKFDFKAFPNGLNVIVPS